MSPVRADVLIALQWVWIVVGGMAVLAAFLPLFLPHEALSAVVPPCPRQPHGGCPTCGLTTAFYAMAHGDPTAAGRAHPLGPALYGLALLHLPIVALVGVNVSRRKSHASL